MTQEGPPVEGAEIARYTVTDIHISLVRRSITFVAQEQPLARLTLSPHGLMFEYPAGQGPADGLSVEEAGRLASQVETADVQESQAADEEIEGMVIRAGRLKSTPKEGRPDRSKKPTAWAKFAAHEEGSEQAHMYLATFHGGTRAIALGLNSGDALTIEGFPHINEDPERSDTFSVIKILNYPGKPVKGEG